MLHKKHFPRGPIAHRKYSTNGNFIFSPELDTALYLTLSKSCLSMGKTNPFLYINEISLLGHIFVFEWGLSGNTVA